MAVIVLSRAKLVNSQDESPEIFFLASRWRPDLAERPVSTGIGLNISASSVGAHITQYLRCDAGLWFIDLARLCTTQLDWRTVMPKFVIEREIPGAGNLSPEELRGISQTSCGVLQEMGPRIQWLHSYVTGDKIYCVYIAPNEEMIREHAQAGGFPANRVSEIKSIIDPTTSEG